MKRVDDSRFFEAAKLKDLGDGIFAFAMTFLIVTFDIPRVPVNEFTRGFLERLPDIIIYVISFFLLAMFWMTNHIQMKGIKRADSRIVWVNIVLFLFIVFIPLTTDLYAFYDGSYLAMLLLNFNILLIALLFILQWHHLVANKLHHDDFTQEEIKDRYLVCKILIYFALLAIAVGFWNPSWSAAVYILLFFVRIYSRIYWANKHAR